ncbi:hypothetical protein CC78DRAFT_409023, partial [Lojkania enalia]
YEKIDSSKGQIRLLRIQKQHLFWGHLRCSIEIARPENASQCEALSYRWKFGSDGADIKFRRIFIDDETMEIPQSAWELLHARSSLYTERLVWLDAVCIDQKNTSEKAGQIPLMGQIYTKATQVIVWPGDRFDSGMASTMVLRLFVTNYQFEAEEEEFRSILEHETGRMGWKAMVNLFENPYFTRIWCVQEVALGE